MDQYLFKLVNKVGVKRNVKIESSRQPTIILKMSSSFIVLCWVVAFRSGLLDSYESKIRASERTEQRKKH